MIVGVSSYVPYPPVVLTSLIMHAPIVNFQNNYNLALILNSIYLNLQSLKSLLYQYLMYGTKFGKIEFPL
jgi:hypothetical protein